MKKFFLFSLVAIYCLLTTGVSAAITNPYTVDEITAEKPRILFGDSVEITATSTSGEAVTYHGLENYADDYVGSYLHITFTYTHASVGASCCDASYPPRLYVTNINLATTTVIQTVSNTEIYKLLNINYNPDHTTNWYLYDVQFDATGYTANVKRAGETQIFNEHRDITGLATSDWVALANLYPIQEPPFDQSYSMSFTPLPVYQAPEEPEEEPIATTTPVIIVPGIMGTKLWKDSVVDNLIWPDTTQIVTSVSDDFLYDLKMDSSGVSIGADIITGDIIRDLNDTDYFTSLFNSLISEDYAEDSDLFENPYDWRTDIEVSALKLKEKINEIKAQRGVEKVDLVAHSMGGLLVKKYLKDFGGDSVEKFIDIGTPHRGSPGAYKILMYGDNLGVRKFFGLININANSIKEISQNMPSVYQLLPSQSYFDDAEYYVADMTNGTSRLDFSSTKNYLKAQGRNSTLVDRAQVFHEEIDNLNPGDYGVETYNIVGCGTPTIGQFYILEGGEHPIYNIKMINGDGTVPLKSAEALTASTTYYVKSAEHATMPSTSGVKELIASLLSTTTPDISPYSNLALTSSGCTIPNGKIVSFHSPIELHIYDSSGNHSGPDENGDIENEIGGVVYEVIDDNKFAFLPDGVEYTIKGNATSEGSFDVRIQELVDGEVASTTVFADIPLTIDTHTEFALGSSIPTQISTDQNNDGIFNHDYGITTVSSGVLESTGKIVVEATSVITETVDSKPVADHPISPVLASPELLAQAGTTSTPTVSIRSLERRGIQPTQPTTSPKSIEPIETRAVVYKSLNYKVKAVFTRFWSWVKSRVQ